MFLMMMMTDQTMSLSLSLSFLEDAFDSVHACQIVFPRDYYLYMHMRGPISLSVFFVSRETYEKFSVLISML